MGLCVSTSLHPTVVETLRQVPFINSHLDDAALLRLARQFDVATYSKDAFIYEIGDPADQFMIVANGEVTIAQQDKFLLTVGRYYFFGEESVCDEETTRPVTAQAAMLTTIISISRQRFMRAVHEDQTSMQPIRSHLIRTSDMMKVQILRKIPFLRGVELQQLQMLSPLLKYRIVQPKQLICKEGDIGEEFYVIAHGQALVTKEKNGRVIPLLTLSDGAYFGEMALVESARRTASVAAHTQCTLLCLSKGHFDDFLEIAPTAKQNLLKQVRDRTVESLRSYDIPLFKALGNDSIDLITEMSKVEHFSPGEIVFEEGAEGTSFYIVSSGALEVLRSDQGFIRSLTVGDYFGELALVSDAPRTATVRCTEEAVLIALDKEVFQNIMKHEPVALALIELRTLKKDVLLYTILNLPEGAKAFASQLAKDYSDENIRFWQAADWYRIVHGGEAGAGRGEDQQGRTKQISTADHDHIPESEVEGLVPEEHAQKSVDFLVNMLMSEGKAPDAGTARHLLARWDRRQMAMKIYKQYISEDAAFQVNINYDTRTAIERSIQQDLFPVDLFVTAQNEVYSLMRDPFYRWKSTAEFNDLLVSVGSYESQQLALKFTSQKSSTSRGIRTSRTSGVFVSQDNVPFSILTIDEDEGSAIDDEVTISEDGELVSAPSTRGRTRTFSLTETFSRRGSAGAATDPGTPLTAEGGRRFSTSGI